MSWMRHAVQEGLIGDVSAAHMAIHWDHGWTAGTPFDDIEDLILYDFGVHWFDFLTSLVGTRARSVFATSTRARGQTNAVPLLAQAVVQLDDGQPSVVFDGAMPHGSRDTTYIGGTKGSLTSEGPDLSAQTVTLTTQNGTTQPKLAGQWFNDGFSGAMGALLCAIEDDCDPTNTARSNLQSLALTFAAVESRRTGRVVNVGEVRRV